MKERMETWKAENLGELFATYLAPRLVSRETKTADSSVDARIIPLQRWCVNHSNVSVCYVYWAKNESQVCDAPGAT